MTYVPTCGSCRETSSPAAIFCESCGQALVVLTARARALIKAERDKAIRASLARMCPECLVTLPHSVPSNQKFCSKVCRKKNWLASPKGRTYQRARKSKSSSPRVVPVETRQVVRLRKEVSRQKARAEMWRNRAVAA